MATECHEVHGLSDSFVDQEVAESEEGVGDRHGEEETKLTKLPRVAANTLLDGVNTLTILIIEVDGVPGLVVEVENLGHEKLGHTTALDEAVADAVTRKSGTHGAHGNTLMLAVRVRCNEELGWEPTRMAQWLGILKATCARFTVTKRLRLAAGNQLVKNTDILWPVLALLDIGNGTDPTSKQVANPSKTTEAGVQNQALACPPQAGGLRHAQENSDDLAALRILEFTILGLTLDNLDVVNYTILAISN